MIESWTGAFEGMCPTQGLGYLLDEHGNRVAAWYFRDRLGDVSLDIWEGEFDLQRLDREFDLRRLPETEPDWQVSDEDVLGAELFYDWNMPPPGQSDFWGKKTWAYLFEQSKKLAHRAIDSFAERAVSMGDIKDTWTA